MEIFDLHVHPGLRPMLLSKPNAPFKVSEYYKLSWRTLIPAAKIFNSQGNTDQMMKGNYLSAVVALHPVEKAFFKSRIIKVISKRLKLNTDYYRPRNLSEPERSYFDWLREEASIIRAEHVVGNINLVQSNWYRKDALNVVFSIEGAYSFFSNESREDDPETIVGNIGSFRNENLVLYITFTHTSQNALCTHAYALKLLENKRDFYPKGNIENGVLAYTGITELGKQCIDAIVRPAIRNFRTLIDVKHMGLRSRLDFYDYYPSDLPIIASHVGVTGFSYKKIGDNVRKVKTLRDSFYRIEYKTSTFDPTSINLYDEEIVFIIKSRGLIGINFDQRIQGNTGDDRYDEIVSGSDSDIFQLGDFITEPEDEDEELDETSLEQSLEGMKAIKSFGVVLGTESAVSLLNVREHIKRICDCISHIIKVAEDAGLDYAENHVCLGTDFDGLIDAVDCCKTADKIPAFKDQLIDELVSGYPHLGDRVKITDRVRKIFFVNGQAFIEKHLPAKVEVFES